MAIKEKVFCASQSASIARSGPMLLFAYDAWLLRGRLAVLDAEISQPLNTLRNAQPKGSWFRTDRHKPWDQLLAPLRAAEKAYHEERDAYLRKEAEG